jgi:hypothetical protein
MGGSGVYHANGMDGKERRACAECTAPVSAPTLPTRRARNVPSLPAFVKLLQQFTDALIPATRGSNGARGTETFSWWLVHPRKREHGSTTLAPGV